jgi:hypothetical protein
MSDTHELSDAELEQVVAGKQLIRDNNNPEYAVVPRRPGPLMIGAMIATSFIGGA